MPLVTEYITKVFLSYTTFILYPLSTTTNLFVYGAVSFVWFSTPALPEFEQDVVTLIAVINADAMTSKAIIAQNPNDGLSFFSILILCSCYNDNGIGCLRSYHNVVVRYLGDLDSVSDLLHHIFLSVKSDSETLNLNWFLRMA